MGWSKKYQGWLWTLEQACTRVVAKRNERRKELLRNKESMSHSTKE